MFWEIALLHKREAAEGGSTGGREHHSGEGGNIGKREHRRKGTWEEAQGREMKEGREDGKEGGERIGGREDHREDQTEDRSNDYLSAPDPLLDTQGPILSPDIVLQPLSQTHLPSQHCAKVVSRLSASPNPSLPAAPSECPFCPFCPGGAWIISLDK